MGARPVCFFTATDSTFSRNVMPRVRSIFGIISSVGTMVWDSSFATTLTRSFSFAPRSACVQPRASRAWRIRLPKSTASSSDAGEL